jgi:hypothetical protein
MALYDPLDLSFKNVYGTVRSEYFGLLPVFCSTEIKKLR